MSDATKVVRACAIGGAVTVLAAIAVAPVLTWWLAVLALLAGFCGGYLSWEFREVVHAVPVVWGSFKQEFARRSQPLVHAYNKSAAFLKDGPHPFFWEWLLLTVLFTSLLSFVSKDVASFAGMLFVFSMVSAFYSFLAGFIITALGTTIWKVDWPTVPREGEAKPKRQWGEVLKWQVTGLVLGLPYMPFESAKAVCRLIKKYFILIHSRERLLCGFDGLLGGLVLAVWVWSDPTMPAAQKALMVGCGAMLGGMFGFINYQIISVKWLKLVPKS